MYRGRALWAGALTLATVALTIATVSAGVLPAPARGLRHAPALPAHAAGGVLRLSDEGVSDLASIDPPSGAANDAQSSLVENLLFGGLVRLDQNLRVQPNAAASWTVSGGGKVYTFTLRHGLRFADGTLVTSADVVYSLDRAFSPAFQAGNTDYYLGDVVGGIDRTNGKAATVQGIHALGADRVQITLDQPAAVILDQLAYAVADIVPRRLIQRYGNTWTDHAFGIGPFRVARWVHGREIDLVPNRYYWRGVPHLRGITVLFVPDANRAYALYRRGAVDVMGAAQFATAHLAGVQGLADLHEQAQLFTEFLTPNERVAPFNNRLVRQAFSAAVNRATIARLLDNRVLPASGILPPGMPGFDPNLQGQTFDPLLARRLLSRAGYPDGKGLPPVTLDVDGGDPDGLTKARALCEFWKLVLHVDVRLRRLGHNAYNDALSARRYQLAFIQWGADYPDPQDFLSLQLQTGSANNNGSYSSATFDALTRRADAMTANARGRYRLYLRAEQLAVAAAAWIVLDWGKADVLIRPSVHGLRVTAMGVTAANWADVSAG
jgi:ABC-type transport system substrate-binding protein